MSTAMWAQSTGGTLAGTVYDPRGAVVPNAAVTITNTATNTSSSSTTSSVGRYAFPSMNVGTYEVHVSAPGFKEAVQSGVNVSVGSTATLDINLQVGQASQSVMVTADAQQIQTDSSAVGTLVTGKLISQLPLNFSGLVRSPIAFLTLTPGFEGDATGNPASQASFKLNGGGTGAADTLLDGASISLASQNYQMNFGISVDAVSEFNVLTSTFPAEFGRTSGGFVTIATKSGGNQIHGGVYEQLKNKALDANSWQNNHTGI
ncbi:MAG: carboxypeptidase-like regulatory domain-containing protein, partial [Edaphobacter sp.]